MVRLKGSVFSVTVPEADGVHWDTKSTIIRFDEWAAASYGTEFSNTDECANGMSVTEFLRRMNGLSQGPLCIPPKIGAYFGVDPAPGRTKFVNVVLRFSEGLVHLKISEETGINLT